MALNYQKQGSRFWESREWVLQIECASSCKVRTRLPLIMEVQCVVLECGILVIGLLRSFLFDVCVKCGVVLDKLPLCSGCVG